MSDVVLCNNCGATTEMRPMQGWSVAVPTGLRAFLPSRVDFCSRECLLEFVHSEAWTAKDPNEPADVA
jgi:hypothetical protein